MEKLIIYLQSQALVLIFSSEDGYTSAKQRLIQDSGTSGCNFFTAVSDTDVRKLRQMSSVTLLRKND